MCLGHHCSVTMEMMRCQSTGKKPPMQDEAKEEDGEKTGRTCALARGPKTSQEAHEVILIHTVPQVSDLLESTSPSRPAQRVATVHRQHLTSEDDVPAPLTSGAPSLTLSWLMASSGILHLAFLFFSEYNSLFPITSLHHPYPPCPLQIQLLIYSPRCFQDNLSKAKICLPYSSSKINSVINHCPRGKKSKFLRMLFRPFLIWLLLLSPANLLPHPSSYSAPTTFCLAFANATFSTQATTCY